jgi:hypothetical protein
MMSQMQGTTRRYPKISLLGRLQPSCSGVQSDRLHRIGLSNNPYHPEISDRSPRGFARSLENRHSMPPLCGCPSVRQACNSSTDNPNPLGVGFARLAHEFLQI